MALSVIIIVKNEAEHISRCLESVAFADEIIILDSGSTDNTLEICKQYTQQVFSTDWQGFGVQKQRALDKAKSNWVLSVDADEQITPELRNEIQAAMLQPKIFGFEIPRLSSYCGKQILHSGWHPDYVLRLFQRQYGSFTADIVHERVLVTGKIQQLNNPILHEAFVDATEVLSKINHYSSLGAQKLYAQGLRTSLKQAIFKACWSFIRTYILKAGYLDGQHGLMLAISNAEGTYYKYLKLLALQQNDSK